MLYIYTPVITNRIRYTFELVFKEYLGLKYKLVDDKEVLANHEGPKLSYTDEEPVDGELCFCNAGLLTEKGVKPQKLSVNEYNGTKIFYNVYSPSALPFDPFSAIFFMVSRYEEYLPHISDKYGRFAAEESFAYKNGFLEQPIVNKYIDMIRDIMAKHYPEMEFRKQHYRFTPTFDIDSAYEHLNKGLIRNVGGYIRSLQRLDFAKIKTRTKVLLKLQKDPFDTFDWQIKMHEKYNVNPIYFFLLGDYDEYDKNISVNIAKFQSLIKSISDVADVGIHPSYASTEDPSKLVVEVKRLSKILKRDINKARQHFLRIKLPITYQDYLENDITDDYSMGFPSQVGFRAGIASSFYFYNLERENKTKLRIHPFCVMDATFKYYLNLDTYEAMSKIKTLINEVRKVNGHFISLWHNNSLSRQQEWKGWRKVYEELVKQASTTEQKAPIS